MEIRTPRGIADQFDLDLIRTGDADRFNLELIHMGNADHFDLYLTRKEDVD